MAEVNGAPVTLFNRPKHVIGHDIMMALRGFIPTHPIRPLTELDFSIGFGEEMEIKVQYGPRDATVAAFLWMLVEEGLRQEKLFPVGLSYEYDPNKRKLIVRKN